MIITNHGLTNTMNYLMRPKEPINQLLDQFRWLLANILILKGPNWDDDLGGSEIYAKNDPNLKNLPEEQRQQLAAIERLVFFIFREFVITV